MNGGASTSIIHGRNTCPETSFASRQSIATVDFGAVHLKTALQVVAQHVDISRFGHATLMVCLHTYTLPTGTSLTFSALKERHADKEKSRPQRFRKVPTLCDQENSPDHQSCQG
jgi:hypothetical protein